MIETCPLEPLGPDLKNLLLWQKDIERRRTLINSKLDQNCYLTTLPYFPQLGQQDEPELREESSNDNARKVTHSDLVSDEAVTNGVRYAAITRNILTKRGKKIGISIPVFVDDKTPRPWRDPKSRIRGSHVDNDLIYMDATTFGACGCSLQVTMQGEDVEEACKLHDQLIPIPPIMLALTAGTSIFRGFLADIDSRWPLFEQAVDDRTEEQLTKGTPARSRVSTSTTYVADDPRLKEEYQLPHLEINKKAYEEFMDGGMPRRLAAHFAHVFKRDPLLVLEEDLANPDVTSTNFSDSLLTNVYQVLRLKPPSSPSAGWRVEFRPMEAQPTDFGNAAFAVFIILLARTIIHVNLNFYIPLARVEENVNEACTRDAARRGLFYFRDNSIHSAEDKVSKMSADEIINGSHKVGGFEGLVPLVRQHLQTMSEFSEADRERIEKYLQLIEGSASGKVATTARWIRELVQGHPKYKRDSVVTGKITFDIIKECIRRSREALEFVK